MSKIITIPKNKEMIKSLLNDSDAFIIGVEGLSINLPFYNTLDEMVEIIQYLNNNNKEVFISLNKNMLNKDLNSLEQTLLKLNELDITGVLFYDMAIINLKEKLNLNLELVWAQEHFVTNYDTTNYWYNFGVKYALVSGEITYDEIIEIRNNTKMKLIVPVFGHLPMFASIRHLVNNYLDFFDINKANNQYYMKKEGRLYPIIDNSDGTFVYSANVLNGLEESIQLKGQNIDYLLLDSYNIDNQIFLEIVKMFKTINDKNVSQYDQKINQLIKNTDKGFLYKETIYKVKKYE